MRSVIVTGRLGIPGQAVAGAFQRNEDRVVRVDIAR
jgi:hypothetical protein